MRFFKKASIFLPEILSVLILSIVLIACEGISSNSGNSGKQGEVDQASNGDGGFLSGEQAPVGSEEGQRTRGLDMSLARTDAFVFADEFPLLQGICQHDTELLKALESYSRTVLGQVISTEDDFLALMKTRDSSLIPHLTPLFENMDANQLDQNWGDYQEELKRLGMTMTAAEGMFTSIGSAPFLEAKIADIGSQEFQAYIQFLNAMTESRNGEYPFQNMRPFRDMVLAGEVIMEGEQEKYKKLIDEDFQFALEAFTDVHYVSSPDTRQVGVALVGGTSTDPYPALAELETAREFVASDQKSQYKKALSAILKNPSEISGKPENIYVIVVEWAETKPKAQKLVRNHLRMGQDVPHYLKIRLGDGTDKYAVSYRFYEEEEKANTAFDVAIKEFPDARLVYCSVKGDKLYQLGI